MYWLPLISRIGKRPKLSVNNVAHGISRKINVLVGAMNSASSLVDGSRLSLALVAYSASAAVPQRVDCRPFWTCVKCPSTLGVAFVVQYLSTFATLRPGNDWKFPALTACRRVDLTGNLMVPWRYSMNFLVDGRSYALRWYSVERIIWALVEEQAVDGFCVGDCIAGSYIVGGTVWVLASGGLVGWTF